VTRERRGRPYKKADYPLNIVGLIGVSTIILMDDSYDNKTFHFDNIAVRIHKLSRYIDIS